MINRSRGGGGGGRGGTDSPVIGIDGVADVDVQRPIAAHQEVARTSPDPPPTAAAAAVDDDDVFPYGTLTPPSPPPPPPVDPHLCFKL